MPAKPLSRPDDDERARHVPANVDAGEFRRANIGADDIEVAADRQALRDDPQRDAQSPRRRRPEAERRGRSGSGSVKLSGRPMPPICSPLCTSWSPRRAAFPCPWWR